MRIINLDIHPNKAERPSILRTTTHLALGLFAIVGPSAAQHSISCSLFMWVTSKVWVSKVLESLKPVDSLRIILESNKDKSYANFMNNYKYIRMFVDMCVCIHIYSFNHESYTCVCI